MKTRFLSLVLATVLALLAGGTMLGTPIADYRDDYHTSALADTPAVFGDGWSYLWNAPSLWTGYVTPAGNGTTGPIGTAANYVPLKWSGSVGNGWSVDGDANSGNGSPGRYLRLHSTGGHPGRGASQLEGAVNNTLDRYAIGAYTVQPGEGGLVSFTNSFVNRGSGGTDGLALQAYIGDSLINSMLAGGGSPSFNWRLGHVSPGDTIYVAVGPNLHDGSDGFGLDYTIDSAAVRYWDANGTAPVDGGTANWDTSNARWATSIDGAAYTTWSNGTNDSAYFGPSAGTVSLSEPITARSLQFDADGYLIDGANALTLTSAGTSGLGPATVEVSNPADTATLDVPVNGTNGLNKIGPGTLAITSNSGNLTGNSTVSDGTLDLSTGALYPNGAWGAHLVTITGGAVVEVGAWTDGDSGQAGIGRTTFEEWNLVIDNGTIRHTRNTGISGRSDRGFTIGAGGATLESAGTTLWDIAEIRPQFDILSTAGGLLTLSGAQNGLVSKEIPGTGGVTKTGAGTWTLSGPNSYAGATTVSGGTLRMGHNSALGGTGTGTTVNAGASLDVNGFTTGAEPVILNGFGVGGQGALINTGGWFGGVNTGAANLSLGSDTSIGGTGRMDLFNPIIGAFDLTKTGSNYVALHNGGSTFHNLNIDQGTVSAEADNTMGDANPIYMATVASGATLQYWSGTASTQDKHVVLDGGVLRSEHGTNTHTGQLTLNNVAGNEIRTTTQLTMTGKITGPGGFTKTGAGRLEITSSNSDFTGDTTVSGGTLGLSNGVLYPNGAWGALILTVDNGGVVEVGAWTDDNAGQAGIGRTTFFAPYLVLDNATIRYTRDAPPTGRSDRGFTIGAGGATLEAAGDDTWHIQELRTQFDIVSTAGGLLTLAGANDGLVTKEIPGTGGVTKTGAGTWTLGGLTTYTGPTTVREGTLVLDGNTLSTSALNVGNGTLTITNGEAVSVSGGTAVADRFVANVDPINAVLNIDSGSLTTQFIVMGNGGGSNINGTFNQTGGTVVTTGTTAENNGVRLGHYPGANVVYNLSGGSLTVGDGRDLSTATDGTGHFLQTGGTANATRVVVNKRANGVGNGTFEVQGGVFNLGAGGIITDEPVAPSTVLLGGLGGTLAAAASWSSPLAMTLSGTGGNEIHFDTNGNDITLSGVLSGSGGLTKLGDGTLNLNGNNTYAGPTAINAGTVKMGHAHALGSTAGGTTVAAGATLDVNGVTTGGEPLTLNGFGVGGNGALINTGGWINGASTGAHNITLGSDASIGGTGRMDLFNPIIGAFDLTKTGSNYVALHTPGSSFHNLNIDQGLISCEANNTMGDANPIYTATVAPGATLQYWTSSTQTQDKHVVLNGGLWTNRNGANTHTGPVTLNSVPGNVIQTEQYGGYTPGGLTISGEITGPGGFTKTGPETLYLTGTNTYTGPTNAHGGTLQVGTGGTAGSLDPTGPIDIGFGPGSDPFDNLVYNHNTTVPVHTVNNAVTINPNGRLIQGGTDTLLLTNLNPANNDSPHVLIRVDGDADFDTGAPTLQRVIPGGTNPGGYGSSSLGSLGSSGDVRLGTTAAGDTTLAMQWRGAGSGEGFLLSDVLSLEGLGHDRPYVLEMSYDEALISGDEAEWAEKGGIFVAWLATDRWGNEGWRNAVLGNLGEGSSAAENYAGQWSDFATAFGVTPANLLSFLGSWGVDTDANLAWAILNHNSEFSVVGIPEPSSFGLLALGLLGLGLMRRK